MMWYFLLILSASALAGRHIFRQEGGVAAMVTTLTCCLLFTVMAPLVLGLSTGMKLVDKPTQITGFVAAVEAVDIIAPTLEVTIDTGSRSWSEVEGQLTTGEDSYSFLRLSSADPNLSDKLKALHGEKATLTFQPWIVQPFRHGLTSLQILDISKAE